MGAREPYHIFHGQYHSQVWIGPRVLQVVKKIKRRLASTTFRYYNAGVDCFPFFVCDPDLGSYSLVEWRDNHGNQHKLCRNQTEGFYNGD